MRRFAVGAVFVGSCFVGNCFAESHFVENCFEANCFAGRLAAGSRFAKNYSVENCSAGSHSAVGFRSVGNYLAVEIHLYSRLGQPLRSQPTHPLKDGKTSMEPIVVFSCLLRSLWSHNYIYPKSHNLRNTCYDY